MSQILSARPPAIRAMTDDELGELVSGDDDGQRMAAIAELDRRDAQARAQRKRNGTRRINDSAWLEIAHAQYLAAERECRGHLLSARGERAGVSDFPGLWTAPAAQLEAWASPELLEFFYAQPRIMISGYRRALAADRADEYETARTEAASTDQEDGSMSEDTHQDAAETIEAAYAAPAAVPPHEEPVSGAAVLDEVRGHLQRFAAFPDEHTAAVAALWCAHTWAFEAFDVTPRLAISSTEPACGKTRVLDLIATLVARPEYILDVTGPTLFALVKDNRPTLLMDEADQVGVQKRTVLGLLNSGYKRGASVPRMSKGHVERYPVFSPAAFAGIGKLPETLQSRCVEIRMRKRRSGERIDSYQPRVHAPLGQAIAASLSAWVTSVLPELASSWPALPDGVEDRASEIWAPLLSVAEVAAGHWPETARRACEHLVLGGGGQPVKSPGLQLLEDIERVWPAGAAKLPTAELVRLLMDVPGNERNWDPASAPRELAAMLRPHGIEPTKVRLGDRTAQGYLAAAFPALRETAAA